MGIQPTFWRNVVGIGTFRYNLGFGDQADKIRIRDWFATLI